LGRKYIYNEREKKEVEKREWGGGEEGRSRVGGAVGSREGGEEGEKKRGGKVRRQEKERKGRSI
jgi:hypothetical protein